MEYNIYKIYNDINDKIYIGQTNHSLKDRFNSHKIGSMEECARELKLNGHTCISRRCLKQIKCPYQGIWNFEFYIEQEPVSTIPDECKGVGLEIGTKPKRKATKVEDIVSADGDIG